MKVYIFPERKKKILWWINYGHNLSKLFIILEFDMLLGLGLTGEMAEKRTGSFHYPPQILLKQQRSKTRVNISSAFPQWSELKDEKGVRSHAEVTTFLLDRWANVCWLLLAIEQVTNFSLTDLLHVVVSARQYYKMHHDETEHVNCARTPTKTVTSISIPSLTKCSSLSLPGNQQSRIENIYLHRGGVNILHITFKCSV